MGLHKWGIRHHKWKDCKTHIFTLLLALIGNVFIEPHVHKFSLAIRVYHITRNYVWHPFKEWFDFLDHYHLFGWFVSEECNNIHVRITKWFCNIVVMFCTTIMSIIKCSLSGASSMMYCIHKSFGRWARCLCPWNIWTKNNKILWRCRHLCMNDRGMVFMVFKNSTNISTYSWSSLSKRATL